MVLLSIVSSVDTSMPKELGSRLGLRTALGLAEAGIAIMDNQIIIGEGGERERER